MSQPASDRPVGLSVPPDGYADWLADLKGRIHTAQQRAARPDEPRPARPLPSVEDTAELLGLPDGEVGGHFRPGIVVGADPGVHGRVGGHGNRVVQRQ